MIIIPRTQLREIMDAAEAAYPGECCGLLIGRTIPPDSVIVSRARASANLGKEPNRFEIDPRLWVDVARALGRGPQKVVGIYHSHPDGAAQPSAIDLEAAWGQELIWIIVSVVGPSADSEDQGAQAVHVTAHMLDHGGRQFRAVELRTEDWKPYAVREIEEPKKMDDETA